MLSILAILFILLGTFTQQTMGNGHGTLTFTIDDSELAEKSPKVSKVEIKRKGEKCGEPIKESKEFTVNWKDCPGVNEAADLKYVEFHIQLFIVGPRGLLIARPVAGLENNTDDELKQFFAGGKATITIRANENNEVKYVVEEDKKGVSRNLTFTVDAHYLLPDGSLAKVMDAEVYQEFGKCEATIVPPNLNESRKFTIDWDSCPKKLNEFTDLDDIQIQVYLSHYKQGDRLIQPFALKDYSDGLLRHLFAGGEAEILINNNNDERKTHRDIKYVKHPNEIDFAHPGLLTFNVGYENENKKIITSLSEVTIEHTAKEMAHCMPEEIKDAKFTVDLAKCKVHNIEDLLNLDIRFKFSIQNPTNPRRKLPKSISVPFSLLKDENVQKQFYEGGHAKIVLNDMDKPSLSYVRSNAPDPNATSRLEEEFLKNLSAFAKKILPGSSSHSSGNPNTVKFTVHFQHATKIAQFESVEIYQKDDKECKTTMESNQFTVDWSECEEKLEKAADLKEIEIVVTFTHGLRKLTSQLYLKHYEKELEKLFAGGEAKITIDVPTKQTALEYVETAQPASLAFNVDYENREGAFFDQVEIKSLTWDVDARCKPLLYEGGKKFSVNLANCGVKTAQDLPNLLFEIRFLLDHAPGKHAVKTLTRSASCYGQSAEELEKYFNGGEAKLVFFDPKKEKATEFFKNKNVEKENPFFALTYLSAPNKPAATSSHRSSENKTLWIELYVKTHLWATEDKKKAHFVNGHYVMGYEKLKIVDEQNMKLRKDGVECPLRTAKHRGSRGDEFKFDVDLAECSAEIKSYQELVGMVLNITYQQGEKAAVKELRYEFTKSDPLHKIFENKLEFRLVEYEHGKVRNQQDGY